jgi:hypothetical protein
MPSPCIHGFSADQCASCRTCSHGLPTGRCGRCLASTTPAARRIAIATAATPPAEEHLGYEIYYEPAVSGWLYRDPDANSSPLSYRSAFLARKAVSEVAERSVAKASRAAATSGS